MEIISAEFVMSNSDYTKCPNSQLPEYAFIGRSNVGKSSLINMLTNKKNLAKTSSKPGKNIANQSFSHQPNVAFSRFAGLRLRFYWQGYATKTERNH